MNAEVSELMARSLTGEELAQRLLDHADASVRQLASYYIDGDAAIRGELEETKTSAEEYEQEAEDKGRELSEAEELFKECLDAIADDSPLIQKIQKWLSR